LVFKIDLAVKLPKLAVKNSDLFGGQIGRSEVIINENL